mmetsp:Transcript_99328/g.176157  ORF Transcript_99328/g.176157 Transcript_99328/m.176157 type:complete len:270 (+) Transcript_99328:83-892(+)
MPGHFDILSARNPVVKELFHLRLKRRERLRHGLALIRGRQIIQAIGEHFPFRRIYTHEEVEKWTGYNAERIVRVTKPVLSHILFPPNRAKHAATLDDDEFVLGTIEQPEPVDEFPESARWILALDAIKQPENMGLLLSTAVALRFDGVFLLEGSIDPFNYKVLQASQAVAWTLPYRHGSAEMLVELCRRRAIAPWAADADGMPVSELPPRAAGIEGFCLAVGNETRGVRPELLASCQRVALPMSELSDSLNAGVAGGILMHALACAWGR